MQQRAETAEGALERERGLHRRELRRRAKELADMQEDLVQVILPFACSLHDLFVATGSLLETFSQKRSL